MSLRVFGAIRAPRRSAAVPEQPFWRRRVDATARESDDLAWFTEATERGAPDLDAEPPWLEWRAPAPAPADVIRWHPLV